MIKSYVQTATPLTLVYKYALYFTSVTYRSSLKHLVILLSQPLPLIQALTHVRYNMRIYTHKCYLFCSNTFKNCDKVTCYNILPVRNFRSTCIWFTSWTHTHIQVYVFALQFNSRGCREVVQCDSHMISIFTCVRRVSSFIHLLRWIHALYAIRFLWSILYLITEWHCELK